MFGLGHEALGIRQTLLVLIGLIVSSGIKQTLHGADGVV